MRFNPPFCRILNLKRRLKGFSLTEGAIVLGVIGIVLGAIWTAAGNVSQNNKVAVTVSQITSMSQGLKALYAPRGQIDSTAGSAITPLLINFGLIPSTMQMIAGAPYHAWGGSFAAYAINAKTFRLSFYSLPTSACIKLETAVASVTGTAAPIGVGSWYTSPPVNGQPGTPYGASSYDALPLASGKAFSPAEAQNLCGGSQTPGDPAVSGSVSAEFDFGIQ